MSLHELLLSPRGRGKRDGTDESELRPCSRITTNLLFGVVQHVRINLTRSALYHSMALSANLSASPNCPALNTLCHFTFRGSARARLPSSCVLHKPWQILGPFCSFRQPASSIQPSVGGHWSHSPCTPRHPTPHCARNYCRVTWPASCSRFIISSHLGSDKRMLALFITAPQPCRLHCVQTCQTSLLKHAQSISEKPWPSRRHRKSQIFLPCSPETITSAKVSP